eukprot:365228-Chlamydomonas_euryale.AAC.11
MSLRAVCPDYVRHVRGANSACQLVIHPKSAFLCGTNPCRVPSTGVAVMGGYCHESVEAVHA